MVKHPAPHGNGLMGLAVQGNSRQPDKIIVFVGEATAELLWLQWAAPHSYPSKWPCYRQCGPEQNQSENKKTKKWQIWSFGRRLRWGKSKTGNRNVCDENVSNTCMRLSNDKFLKKYKQSNTLNKEKA